MVTTSSPEMPVSPAEAAGLLPAIPGPAAPAAQPQPMLEFICRRVADLEKKIGLLAEMEQRILQRIDQGQSAILAELKRMREATAPAAEKRPMLAPLVAAAPSIPWPVMAPATEEPAAPDLCPGEEGTPGQVVLLVDDDAMVRQVTTGMLMKAGYTVDSASGGEAAIRAMEQHPGRYGVVLLDLAMPGMSGEQTFRHFRQQQWNIPVIFYSGYGYQLAELFARYGGKNTEFLQKPFEPPQLIERVRRQLAAGQPDAKRAPEQTAAGTFPPPLTTAGVPVTLAAPPAAAAEGPPPLPVTGPVPPVETAA